MPPPAYDPAARERLCGRGVYFVTLRVADHRPLFGTVVNGRMALNDAGRAAARLLACLLADLRRDIPVRHVEPQLARKEKEESPPAEVRRR